MIRPNPFQFRCPKCNYIKYHHPKSDVLNPMDMVQICPKCKISMKREELSGVRKVFGGLFG